MTLKRAMQSSEESDESMKAAISKLKIEKLREQINTMAKQRDTLTHKIKRQSNKMSRMETLIAHLSKKRLIDAETETILQSLPVAFNQILKRLLSKKKNVPYNEDERKFSLTLNYLSPVAYKYVRDTFGLALPSDKTLYLWYSVLNVGPGFCQQAFDTIKLQQDNSQKQLFVELVYDEMSVQQGTKWINGKCCGLVDYGIPGVVMEDEATKVLVFMATCLNAPWAEPLGFFPIRSMNGDQKANFTKLCILKLMLCGVKVVGVTCDGASENFTAFKILGCNFKNPVMETTFLVNDTIICSYPDPVHMMKLIRLALRDIGKFKDGYGQTIDWSYLVNLVSLQEQEYGLHLSTKIRKLHIYFSNQKMKVKLAVQLLSLSVAQALRYCEKILKISQFQGCSATADFIEVCNNLFDILNSHVPWEFGFKKAMCPTNRNQILEYANFGINYLENLVLLNGQKLVDSSRWTGFKGIIICLKNLRHMYKVTIEDGGMDYLGLYRCTQDPLEIFFEKIRCRRLGTNNNPMVYQFIYAFKRILAHTQISDRGLGNCIPLEKIEILSVNLNKKKQTHLNDGEEEENHKEEEKELELIEDYRYCSDFHFHIITYIKNYLFILSKKKLTLNRSQK